MTEPNVPPTEASRRAPVVNRDGKVALSEWALAILLTTLIGLSGAALLATFIMELMYDSTAAWTRIAVLLPVLLISSYLLVQLWRKLINRRKAAKK